MKTTKKVLALLMTMFIATTVFAGCNSTTAPSEEAGAAESSPAPQSAAANPATSTKPVKIGMATFMMAQEWYQNIVTGAQNRADELGVELIVADANNDSATQVTAIENFIAQKVDAIIVSPVDEKALATVVQQAEDNGIKIICESNMVEGADTKVGVSDFESGKVTGQWFADYAKANSITPNILILGYKSLENCRNRSEGFKEGMTEAGLEYTIATEVDGGFREASMNAATDALTANPNINVVFGINDDSTLGAISAIKQANLPMENFTTILYGLEGVAGRTALNDGTATAGLSMFPEYVGTTCLNAAMDALEGKELPEVYLSPTTVVEKSKFNDFFIEDNGVYKVNFEAVGALAD